MKGNESALSHIALGSAAVASFPGLRKPIEEAAKRDAARAANARREEMAATQVVVNGVDITEYLMPAGGDGGTDGPSTNVPERRALNRADRRACKRKGHCTCSAPKPCCYCGAER